MTISKTLAVLSLASLSLSGPAAAAPAAPPIPRGTEIRVNANTTASHGLPKVAVFPDGGFVVVWSSTSGERARFFDRKGKPAGGERPLALGIAGYVNQVVADRDGSFLVVWSGVTAARPAYSIYFRRFNRDGTPRGNAMRANAPNPSDRYNAVAAIGTDGRFAIAWRSAVPLGPSPDDGRYTDAVGRIFKASGAAATPEIVIRQGEGPSAAGDDTINVFPTSLALAPDGTLTTLIHETDCDRSYLVRMPSSGGPGILQLLGSPFCGPGYPGSSLAMGIDGSLVATWIDYSVTAQRFAPSGAPRGPYFMVSQNALNYQRDAAVALQAGGTFVVVWTDLDGRDGDGKGVYGRAFAANGTPRTGDFRINTTTAGDQFAPSIAAARQGPVVVAWTRQEAQDGRSDVFVRVLSATP
jgi:hypothetical protein